MKLLPERYCKLFYDFGMPSCYMDIKPNLSNERLKCRHASLASAGILRTRVRPIWLHLITIFFTKRMFYSALKYELMLLPIHVGVALAQGLLIHCKDDWFAIVICTARSLSCCTLPRAYRLRREDSERRGRCYELQTSNFHTSQKLQLSPIVTLAACTFLQFGSVASGYYLRQWWLRRTPDEQAKYRRRYYKRRRILLGSMGLFTSILLIYYTMHLEMDPVVQRPRFVIFNEEDQATLGNMILTMLLVKYKEDIIPISDPVYSKLTKILRKLANANKDVFKNTHWTISVVNAPSMTNAMVLPSGNVFVFSGIFNVVENDDQLTFVLAHEMSHVLLLHTMEILSYTVLKELAYVLPTFLIWACFSRTKALGVYLGAGFLHKVLVQFPYQRQLELEADEVGLELAAKSCIDVREVLLFWEIMKKYSDLTGESQFEMPILMTHPTHMYRNTRLAHQMPRAFDLREKAGCPKLPKLDLQKELERYTKDLEERFQKQEMFVTVSP